MVDVSSFFAAFSAVNRAFAGILRPRVHHPAVPEGTRFKN